MNDAKDDAIRDALAEGLSEVAYLCGRVWEAWDYGTMGEDDFAPASEDEEFLDSLVVAVREAVKPRVIENVEEMDELPLKCVLRNESGLVIQNYPAGWTISGDGWYESSYFDRGFLPATVIYEPTA